MNILTTEDMAVGSGVNPAQMDFWDGLGSVFLMPSITPAGTGRSAAHGDVGTDSAVTHVGLGTAVTHTQGCCKAESQQEHSTTWNFPLFQSEGLSGMQWPATSNNSCHCTRWDNTLGQHPGTTPGPSSPTQSSEGVPWPSS